LKQPGLDHRLRDKQGEISRKHGNTRISTLRLTCGPRFAPDIPGNVTLKEVIETLAEPSLSELFADLEKK
jgi:hypothetical protein